MSKGSIKRLINSAGAALYPVTVAEAVYVDPYSTLKTMLTHVKEHTGKSNSYVIELARWGIADDGTHPVQTTQGINDAIRWAKANGYNHVILPNGDYTVSLDVTGVAIHMISGMHLELGEACRIKLASNSFTNYAIIQCKKIAFSKVSGGELIGDRQTHQYELSVRFERGGVNEDGSLNNDPNFIRSHVIDRYDHPGLLAYFRLWQLPEITAQNYSFYQYKDSISKATLVGSRTNGGFAPKSPEGRGWFAPIEQCNKMIFVVDVSGSSLSDAQVANLQGRVDNSYYTHESGHGVTILSSNHIEISHMQVSQCTGDGIITGIGVHYLDPAAYTQEEMGQFIYIHDCDIHHCRRQGISLCGPNDVYVLNNTIHHIGFADNGVDTDFRSGTAPMFGIDIESLVVESNIPYKSIYLNRDGLETNYRILIENNHIYHNVKGHFVNTDGTHIMLKNNIFEGKNIGGIISYPHQWYVQYLNNTFIKSDLVVSGNNIVDQCDFYDANLNLQNVMGASIHNCRFRNGLFHGSSIYGYLGTPQRIDVKTGTFTFENEHNLGNGARVCFEQWQGKLPGGVNADQVYYTVNTTRQSFQVSLSQGGEPVTLTDEGAAGFNISRFNYGRLYISNVIVEKDWNEQNEYDPQSGFRVLLAGAVIEQLTLKNCNLAIQIPANYAGRPNLMNDINVIEGTASFASSQISNLKVIRVKKRHLGGDVNLGGSTSSSHVNVNTALFQGVQVNFGHATLLNGSFYNSAIYKSDTTTISTILNSYLEQVTVSLSWLTYPKSMTIANSAFQQVSLTTNANTRLLQNLDLETGLPF